jgi:histidyl-tRNA synthetase
LVSLVGGVSAPASGFALDIDTISPLLIDAEVGEPRTIAIRPAENGGADLAAAFSLARTLRQSDVRVEIAAAPQERPGVDVAASSTGFVFTDDGGEPRQLAAVDDVVRAVAESTR